MFSVLLLLLVTQIPCAQGESTAVCHCKQGAASACEALDPRQAAELQKELRVLRVDAQDKPQPVEAEASESEATDDDSDPPDCKGQEHHLISKRIFRALDRHPTLTGVYKSRDSRLVTRAVDEAAHCGYQDWHRKVDKEVIKWLETYRSATAKQFEAFFAFDLQPPRHACEISPWILESTTDRLGSSCCKRPSTPATTRISIPSARTT